MSNFIGKESPSIYYHLGFFNKQYTTYMVPIDTLELHRLVFVGFDGSLYILKTVLALNVSTATGWEWLHIA